MDKGHQHSLHSETMKPATVCRPLLSPKSWHISSQKKLWQLSPNFNVQRCHRECRWNRMPASYLGKYVWQFLHKPIICLILNVFRTHWSWGWVVCEPLLWDSLVDGLGEPTTTLFEEAELSCPGSDLSLSSCVFIYVFWPSLFFSHFICFLKVLCIVNFEVGFWLNINILKRHHRIVNETVLIDSNRRYLNVVLLWG